MMCAVSLAPLTGRVNYAFQAVLNYAVRVLYGYVPKTDKIKVDSTGTGGFAEMCESMSDGRVNYGFIRYNVNGTFKVYVRIFKNSISDTYQSVCLCRLVWRGCDRNP